MSERVEMNPHEPWILELFCDFLSLGGEVSSHVIE